MRQMVVVYRGGHGPDVSYHGVNMGDGTHETDDRRESSS
jgi:hypothetical protein